MKKKTKLVTLNIHSHFDKMQPLNFKANYTIFSDFIEKNEIDIFALQECCQSHGEQIVKPDELGNFFGKEEDTVIWEDNYAFLIARELEKKGKKYNWSWCSAKLGYGQFDEGLALFSRYPILDTKEFYISNSHDFSNWKTRKVIGIKVEIGERSQWFYSVHMGWWSDKEEPFVEQVARLEENLGEIDDEIFLMGDFNSPAQKLGEGYEFMKKRGWLDTYELAIEKDHGITVAEMIDGWDSVEQSGMRIDYIWAKNQANILSSKVIFSGETEPVISDHFGVMVVLDVEAME